jgi:methionyl-tRNA formyltransferase
MTSESKTRTQKYALLLNGANFACEVLQALQQRRAPPDLLVLPEYAPAAVPVETTLELVESRSQRRLLRLAGSIPVAYAPAARQEQCAQLIRLQSIDFLLVACWPYLISPILIASAAKAALNLHPSLLPMYRGPDPVTRQIECGARSPGVTLHLLNREFDAGDIVAQARLSAQVSVAERTCFEREAARLGSKLFIEAINRYDAGWQTRVQANPPGSGDSSGDSA